MKLPVMIPDTTKISENLGEILKNVFQVVQNDFFMKYDILMFHLILRHVNFQKCP